MRTKYIFITGGVISTLGKGITTASIAALLKAIGYRVTCVKCDMYVNIDAGTMRPTEHGEVFVGEDGIEADQDLGNYERFINQNSTSVNYITTGQIYQEVIRKERNLEYGGEDVEVVPHVPEEIIRRIKLAGLKHKAQIVLVEFGGTVGEYQTVLFLEADRMLKREFPRDVVNVHVSYLPVPPTVGEMKTKPVQYSVRTLQAAGIQPEFVVGRSSLPLDKKRIEKIALFCNVDIGNVISNPDVGSIYEIPLIFDRQNVADKITKSLSLPKFSNKTKNWLSDWKDLSRKIKSAREPIKIGIVGKYFDTGEFILEDSYISIIEAIKHAAWQCCRKPEIQWIDSGKLEKSQNALDDLKSYDGIIVPGGFGSRGVDGKIKAIEYVRKSNIPYLGLCYGMQLAIVEFARNVLNKKDAHTEEINPKTKNPVIHILPEQKKLLRAKAYGASMRLGAYQCHLQKGSKARELYGKETISERHRHRYEFNNKYRADIEKAGFMVSGVNDERNLVEIVELANHPFFVGVQFHPEFKSRPLDPHPLFLGLIKAGIQTSH